MPEKVLYRSMMRLSDGRIMPYSATLVAAHPGKYVEWDKTKGKGSRPLVVPPEETPLLKIQADAALAPAQADKPVVLPSDTDPDNPADPAAEAEMAARLAGAKAAGRNKRK